MKSGFAPILIMIVFIVLLTACQDFKRDNDITGQGEPVTESGQLPDDKGDAGILNEGPMQQPADPKVLHDEFGSSPFKREQIGFSRVRTAVERKYPLIKELFSSKGIQYPPKAVYLRAFKKEGILELWIKSGSQESYVLLKCYDICRSSGEPGPKRQEGDRQVPEGFYHINHFNPSSSFFLSLGINYPNASDRILGVQGNLGGEIYIHGGCATAGCIPVTDDGIMELYLIAVEAKSQGQDRIPVHIFPTGMDGDSFEALMDEHIENSRLTGFWANLKEGFDAFEENGQIPEFSVDNRGRYIFE